ncbi:MAG: hypothetical protein ACYDCS_00005, partial [Candidatus Dormibacteria bacterium]
MGMFQMLLLAKGQRNLLRAPGAAGRGPGVDVPTPLTVPLGVAAPGLGVGPLDAFGCPLAVGLPREDPPVPDACGACVATRAAAACPHAAIAIETLTNNASREPPLGLNARGFRRRWRLSHIRLFPN